MGGTNADGSIRIWDWQRQPPLVDFVPTATGIGPAINALAISPDGRYLVIGRESGSLERYDTGALRNWRRLNEAEIADRRAIEALAFSPDGMTLAVSALKESPTEAGVPRSECVITLRSMPDGEVARTVRTTRDKAPALSFNPSDGRFLAVGGGEAQEIALVDLRAAPEQPAVELRGPGTVLWDVGFVNEAANQPTVAYTRNRPLREEQEVWEGFDLPERRFVQVEQPARLSRARTSSPGWSIQPNGPLQLTVSPAQGNPVRISLTLDEDGRWSSYTFIPPDPAAGHPRLTVAIGCQGGNVLIYSLPDGTRTRVLSGHADAVHGLAPSPDGRWLATVAADQTVRLWSLAGCDVRAPLGAKLTRDAQGNWIVSEVSTRSFAHRMGLSVGDDVRNIIERPSKRVFAIDRIDAELDRIEPRSAFAIEIKVTRGGGAIPVAPMTTNRFDESALSLLPASDKEWIIWMPEGYYDTSIAGDRRLLGWHINKVNAANPAIIVPLPSEFHPMSRFEKQLHKPGVIDTVLRTGDVIAALQLARGAPLVEAPPTIRILAPAGLAAGAQITVQQPTLALRVVAEGGSPNRRIKSIVVRNETATFPIQPIAAPAAKAEVAHDVKLRPDLNNISIVATDDLGIERIERIGVRLDLPDPTPPVSIRPRLLIRSIGIEDFDEKKLQSIKYARNDASILASFLMAPDQKVHFPKDQINTELLNEAPTSKKISDMFKSLSGEIRARHACAGDTVFLVLETYVFNRGPSGSLLLGADANLKTPNADAVAADVISHCLEEVAAEGCLVFLLLDGIHKPLPIPARRQVNDWVRDLNDRGVYVLVASKQEESLRLEPEKRSAFVQAIEDSVTVAGGARPGDRLTLEEFKNNVIRRVAEHTRRTQFADLYPPKFAEHVDRIRIFEPQTRPVENLVTK